MQVVSKLGKNRIVLYNIDYTNKIPPALTLDGYALVLHIIAISKTKLQIMNYLTTLKLTLKLNTKKILLERVKSFPRGISILGITL